MIINKFSILDYGEKTANSFIFSTGANIICSEKSTVGKSSLLKSIYYCLGLTIKNFAPGWQFEKMYFKIDYTHNNQRGAIIRHKDTFWVEDSPSPLSTKEYSSWLLNLLDLHSLKLPLKNKDELHDVHASAPLCVFYVDQDTSWNGIPYKNTTNLEFYKPDSIPKKIFEYMFGLNNNEIIELEDEQTILISEQKKVQKQRDVLEELQGELAPSTSNNIIIDTNQIRNEISNYLELATEINQKVNKFKAKIYKAKVEKDSLEIELEELKLLIKYLTQNYRDIENKCTQCDSQLTPEQTLKRLRLDANKFSAITLKNELEQKITRLTKTIIQHEDKKLHFENHYNQILFISEDKNNEISLSEYIEEEAKKQSQLNYNEILQQKYSRISELSSLSKNIKKEIALLKKKLDERKEQLSKSYDIYIGAANTAFPKANIDFKFLEFKNIKNSGAVYNENFLSIYSTYSKLLSENSNIKIPFGIDTIIKDELDPDIVKSSYKLIEQNILQSSEQSFAVMLKDKLDFLDNKKKYKIHNLDSSKKILKKDKYNTIKSEFETIFQSYI